MVLNQNRIIDITEKKPPKGAHILDARNLVILPGFIQTHLHLCQTLFRNQADDLQLLDWLSKRIWPLEAAHTAETLHTSALLGIHELLATGTTCILDMGTVRHTESIFEAVKSSGIRASVGKCLMDHPTDTPAGLRESTQKALREAELYFKKWDGAQNDRIRVSYAPRFAISCTDRLLRNVGNLAREKGAIIHTHASENRGEIEWVKKRTGLKNIEYLHQVGLAGSNLVLAHCVWTDSEERSLLKQTGTHVAHCPSSNLKLASGIAPIPTYLKAGINVSLGVDGAPSNNQLSLFSEMKLAALLHKPKFGPTTLPAMEVLDLATRNGAKALNWFNEIGSIEVGKKADLIALDLKGPYNCLWEKDLLSPEAIASSIVYSSSPTHLKWTMVDGKVVFRDGEVKTIALKPLMKQIAKSHRHFQTVF